MKISFNSVTFYQDKYEVFFKKISESNYDAIELNAETLPWATPHVDDKTSNEELDNIINLSNKYNLDISSIGAHIDISQKNDEDRKSNIKYIKKCIDHSQKIKCPIVHIFSGELKKSENKDEKLEIFYDSVKEISEYGFEKEIKIALEPIVGHVFHTYHDFENIWHKLGEDNIWVNYDPSHYEAQKLDIKDSLNILGKKIINVHMKDAMGKFPYFQFPPLGKGNIDFKFIIKELEKLNYKGVLSIEYEAQVFGWEFSEEEILKNNYQFVNNLLN